MNAFAGLFSSPRIYEVCFMEYYSQMALATLFWSTTSSRKCLLAGHDAKTSIAGAKQVRT